MARAFVSGNFTPLSSSLNVNNKDASETCAETSVGASLSFAIATPPSLGVPETICKI